MVVTFHLYLMIHSLLRLHVVLPRVKHPDLCWVSDKTLPLPDMPSSIYQTQTGYRFDLVPAESAPSPKFLLLDGCSKPDLQP